MAQYTQEETQIPPASELPSYNEALRLKKLECNEIPPGYYTSLPIEDTSARITIDAADVIKTFYLILG
jgi:hypothetical protein